MSTFPVYFLSILDIWFSKNLFIFYLNWAVEMSLIYKIWTWWQKLCLVHNLTPGSALIQKLKFSIRFEIVGKFGVKSPYVMSFETCLFRTSWRQARSFTTSSALNYLCDAVDTGFSLNWMQENGHFFIFVAALQSID